MSAARDPIPLHGWCPSCGLPIAGPNLMSVGLDPMCKNCWEAPGEDADHTARNPHLVASEQIEAAREAMDRPLSSYLHLPFPSVNALVGAIPPGDIGFVAAFSGMGKTTFITSAIKALLDSGKRVYCLPLEVQDKTFRTHLACKSLGYHAGMVLTGEYKRTRPDEWPAIRRAILEEMAKQERGDMAERLYISPTRRMDTVALTKAAHHAASLEADVLIIDHMGHLKGSGTTGHAENVEVIDRSFDLTQELGLATIGTIQVNHEGVKNDPLGIYQIPQPHHIYMGGKARHVAAWFLGLGRPLKFTGLDRDLLAQVRAKRAEAWRVLEPNCMSVGLMKSRHFGERDGQRTYLAVRDGCATEDPALIALAEHGIRTGGFAA